MTQQDPPWFPGQFGRRDDTRPDFTGDPYTSGSSDAEPYAPATLNTRVTNPYGDLPLPPDGGGPGPGPTLPDGAAAPPATPADVRAEPAAPAGYEDFYEPGSADREDLRPPRGRRRRPTRRRGRQATEPAHGPRPGRRGRKRAGDPTPTITVVPGGTAPARADTATGTGRADSPAARTGRDGQAGASGGRWRRNLLVLVLGGVVVSFVVGVVSGLGDEPDPQPTTTPTTSPTPSPAPTTSPGPTPDPLPSPTAVAVPDGEVAVGVTVADGPFKAEVLGVSTGLTDLAGATATTTAEGEYVVVRLRVTATAPGTAYFLDIDQRLVDAGGTEHEPDPRAAMAVDGNQLWFAELEAGESAEGVVVFDVPAGTVPATFVLQASDQSAGAPVELPTP